MSTYPQYNANPRLETKKVWYSGTDVLYKGYALCYDVAASAGTEKTSLGRQVVQPATANLMAFAGIVQDGEVQGPAFVTIAVPRRGEFLDVYTKANATAFATALAPADGSYALAAHSDATLNLPMVAVAAETANTSVTAANKPAMLLGG